LLLKWLDKEFRNHQYVNTKLSATTSELSAIGECDNWFQDINFEPSKTASFGTILDGFKVTPASRTVKNRFWNGFGGSLIP